ncbi:hypothetical protein F7725_004476 [Dissostichus mawsoni]|uniref:PDZ domain-containing protein n=1 Tax=Dissostichus mawsoni TaxID=36200 RepID=A0A7J5XIT6_DISMA|nr:hypothetical protein F7725_004476 [Dissostichus mawsoni]
MIETMGPNNLSISLSAHALIKPLFSTVLSSTLVLSLKYVTACRHSASLAGGGASPGPAEGAGEVPTEEKLSLLKSVLQSPLFHQILALQKSESLPGSCETDLCDHVAAVKPNGGHVSYSDISASTLINGKPSSEEFEHLVHSMAQGRYLAHVDLQKPESGGLGFSVVGLKSENRGELGIFIQEIQAGSVADWYVRINTP